MYHDPLAVESVRGSAYILRYFLNFLSCNMIPIVYDIRMETKMTGHKYNNFLRRFRLKVKPSSKVYGKKDRRRNRNAHKGDDL